MFQSDRIEEGGWFNSFLTNSGAITRNRPRHPPSERCALII